MWNDNTRYWLTPQELEDYIIATEIYGDECYDEDGELIDDYEYDEPMSEYVECSVCGGYYDLWDVESECFCFMEDYQDEDWGDED